MKLRVMLLCLLILGLGCSAFAAGTVPAKGKVIDLNDQPVVGIKVFALDCGSSDKSKIAATTVTGEDGVFAFASLPKSKGIGYYFVAYEPEKYLGWAKGTGELWPDSWQDGPQWSDGHIILVSKPGAYTKSVVDENGKAIAGAKVHPQYISRDGEEESATGIGADILDPVVKIQPATTDASGSYSLQNISEGAAVDSNITANGYTDTSYGNAVDAHVLKAVGSISGRILNKQGKPVSGATVDADLNEGLCIRDAKSRADGSFTIRELASGTYELTASADGKVILPASSVKVTAGKTTKRNLTAVDGVSVSGRVLDAVTRKPLVNAAVSLHDADYNFYSAKTNSRGAFTIKTLLCKASVDAEINNYDTKTLNNLAVTKRGLKGITFKLSRARMAGGKVVDESGKAVPGAVISIGEGLNRTIRADANGKFKTEIYKKECSSGG